MSDCLHGLFVAIQIVSAGSGLAGVAMLWTSRLRDGPARLRSDAGSGREPLTRVYTVEPLIWHVRRGRAIRSSRGARGA